MADNQKESGLKKSNKKPPVIRLATDSGKLGDTDLVQSFQMLLENKELVFQLLDQFPFTIEIFSSDGKSVFINQAGLRMNNIPDASFIVGKYNLLNDPVCNDQMGLREDIRKAFNGETVSAHDVSLSIQDLVDRSVIGEKPFEKALSDLYLYPIKNNGKLVFVVFVCIFKKLYYGRTEVAKAKEYIDEHWRGEFDAQSVAKIVNISVTQLYKLFKQQTGMTPGEYQKKCKVERIREKLADKNLSIKEAFAACGEDSQSRIARVFKKLTGLSPAEFRKLNS